MATPQMRGTVLSAYAFFFAFGQLASAIALNIINTVSSLINVQGKRLTMYVDNAFGIPFSVLFPVRTTSDLASYPSLPARITRLALQEG